MLYLTIEDYVQTSTSYRTLSGVAIELEKMGGGGAHMGTIVISSLVSLQNR